MSPSFLRHIPPMAAESLNPADTVWVLLATGLVLLMTPGLAFFYGGLVRAKNTLNTMMMSFAALGVVGVAWALVGYSIAFGGDGAWFGGAQHLFLQGVTLQSEGGIPQLLFMMFQGTFAIITAALISGALVERMRFVPFVTFMVVWMLLIYAPVAHWVWGGGWLAELGALDFAGGAVVHVNAGIAAVVAAMVLGPRKDFARQAILPHNVPFVLLGTALLWFGWLGFNGGSALGANRAAVLAVVNTILAPAAASVVWMALDHLRERRVTAVGIATSIVVGLVAVTPAAGFVGPSGAMAIGALAALPSYGALLLKSRLKLDDSLDVAAAHGLGGLVGAILTGVFAETGWGEVNGALFGNVAQLWPQALSVLAVIAYSGAGSWLILKALGAVMHLRADAKHEGVGLDVTEHGEEAYAQGEGAVLLLPDTPASRPQAESKNRVPLGKQTLHGGQS